MSTATVEAQERTRAFARVIGPYVATFTTFYAFRLPDLLGLLDDLLAQPVLVWLLGALMLGAGLVIIGAHRNWRGPLAVTVSLFGWFVAVRGFLLVVTPDTIRSAAVSTVLSPTGLTLARVFFGVLAVIGLLLTYAGWFTGGRSAGEAAAKGSSLPST
ncbi:hypothetical protein ACFFQW_41185 [Umezawaea endophytica]|uniref:Uncharacterized protein n=1 Tax=Umezawaea endophytica TaxID=1654476 RepID=A0A9X2VFJ1_9PSEU|nr:hypothetical protein [Umezawaea endophytica]MCS7475735.1 hypothetical protein [Umezawaea endophytica]